MSVSLVPLLGGAILLLAVHRPRWRRAYVPIALVSLAGAAALQAGVLGDTQSPSILPALFIHDHLATPVAWLAIGLGMLLVFALDADNADESSASHLALTLVSLAGLMLAAAASDLVVLLAAIETVSCCAVLAGWFAHRGAFRPAGGIQTAAPHLVSALLLTLGFALIYALTASIDLSNIQSVLTMSYATADASRVIGRGSVLGVAAIVLVFAGLGWRLAVVPFHFGRAESWGRDWRSGLLSATVARAAAFVVLVRVLAALRGFEEPARLVATVLAGLTLIVAGVRALSRGDVRIMLADLVVLEGGFLLTGIAAALALPGSAEGTAPPGAMPPQLTAGVAALAVSLVATMGAVSVLLWLDGSRRTYCTADDLAGLARSNPAAAACLGVSLLTLAGVPPVIGFWTRWSLVVAALTAPAEATAAGTFGLDAAFVVLVFCTAGGTVFAAIVAVRLLEPVLLAGPLGRAQPAARYAAVSAIGAALAIAGASCMPGRTLDVFDELSTPPNPSPQAAGFQP